MQYTRLGNTGLIVSRLALGAMTFGTSTSTHSIFKVDQESANTLIEKAIAAGINFFDTADGYAGGQSEVMLGKLLADKRQEVIIATKVGFRNGKALTQSGLSRGHIIASCEASLKRLGTDYLDLYIVHREDRYTPLEETLSALNDLVRSGKVRYLGFSNWSAWKAATALQLQKANGWAQFVNGQLYYSLLGRDVEHELVPLMLSGGIGMTIWSPLAGGFLSGKYTRDNLKDSENRLAGFDFLPFDKETGFKLVERLKEIAQGHNGTTAQIAIAWLLTKPVVTSVIIGASKLHQLEDNLKAVEIKLSEAEIAELDQLTAPTILYPNWFNINLADPQHKEALG